MHPTIEEIQRAREVSPRMVGFGGKWTRELEQMEREYVAHIQRLQQEIEGLMTELGARVGVKKGKA